MLMLMELLALAAREGIETSPDAFLDGINRSSCPGIESVLSSLHNDKDGRSHSSPLRTFHYFPCSCSRRLSAPGPNSSDSHSWNCPTGSPRPRKVS